MHIEVQVALNFIISYLYNKLPRRRVNIFGEELEKALKDKYKGHWYEDCPCKGTAYRCVKTGKLIDPVFLRAARESGIPINDVMVFLPKELEVWIDPGEVSYRVGEHTSIKILYKESNEDDESVNPDSTPDAGSGRSTDSSTTPALTLKTTAPLIFRSTTSVFTKSGIVTFSSSSNSRRRISRKIYKEVQVGTKLILSYLNTKLPEERINLIGEQLEKALMDKIEGHWYPEFPAKGTSYRCVKTGESLDPVFERVARETGVPISDIIDNLPKNLSLWIDPYEVSYRINDDSAINILYKEGQDSESSGSNFILESTCSNLTGPSKSISPMTSPDTAISTQLSGDGIKSSPSSTTQSAPLNFTTFTHPQNSFGNNRGRILDSNKRGTRMTSVEFTNYIKERAMSQQMREQQQLAEDSVVTGHNRQQEQPDPSNDVLQQPINTTVNFDISSELANRSTNVLTMATNQNDGRIAFLNTHRNVSELVIEEFLKSGDINYQLPSSYIFQSASPTENLEGCTALHVAAKQEDLVSIKMLLKNGSDITIKDGQGMTALHRAIEYERSSIHSPIHKLRGLLKDLTINALLSAHVDYDIIENPRSKNGISHVHAACIINNVQILELLLKNGASADETVSAKSPILPGYAPLHFAVRYCSVEAAKILLKHGAQPHPQRAKNLTPLHMLIQRNMQIADWMNMGKRAFCDQLQKEYEGNESIIKAILEKTSEEIIDDTGLSRLHVACMLKETSILEKVLEETTDTEYSVKTTSNLWPGYTALHFAAHFNVSAIKLLMSRGANMLIRAVHKFTPLDLCLQRYEPEIIHNLVDSQADWRNIKFSDAQTKLLDFICSMKNTKEFYHFIMLNIPNIDTFIPHDSPIFSGYTPLHFVTVAQLKIKDIDDLIKDTLYEAEMDNCFPQNFDEWKASELSKKRIQICLGRKPNMTIQDCQKSTALQLGFKLQYEYAVRLMCNFTELCDNSINEDGLSHFQIACVAGAKRLVEVLLHKNSKYCMKNSSLTNNYKFSCNGRPIVLKTASTPLHIAVVIQNFQLVEYFLYSSYDIHAQDIEGMTPIHRSITNPKICNLLLNWKIKNLRNRVADCGLSHLHVACAMKNIKAVEILIEYGADVNATISMDYKEDTSLRGLNPLQIAVKGRSREIVKILIRAGAKIASEPHQNYKRYTDMFEYHAVKGKPVDEVANMTELHVACFTNDVDRVKELLLAGADPNARIHPSNPVWANYTPLHLVASGYRYSKESVDAANSIIKMLIDNGADVTLTTNDNDTPLNLAFNKICQMSGDDRKTYLSKICKSTKGLPIPKRLDSLLKMPPADFKTQLLHGWNENDQSQNICLKEGAPLTLKRNCTPICTDGIRGKIGYTKGLHVWEIHWSTEQRGTHAVVGVATAEAPLHAEGYQNLIGSDESSWGWDIERRELVHNSKNNYDRESYLGYLDSPLKYPKYHSSLYEASTESRIVVPEKITVILDMDEGTLGYMVDDKYLGVAFDSLKGKTLYPAVSIVRAGGEVTMKYIGGFEKDDGFRATLDVLLSGHRDFNVNPTNNKGISTFHIACLCNNVPIVEKFLENGVNVNQPIDHFCDIYAGCTPLHLAAYHKHTETVNLLIKYGADIHAKNREGKSPLHCAADYSDYLLRKTTYEEFSGEAFVNVMWPGADIKDKNRFDQTPIDVLMETEGLSTEIVQIFFENLTCVNTFNRFDVGFIATAIARETNIKGILKNPVYAAVINHPGENGPDNMGRTPIHNIVALKQSDEKSSLTAQIYLEAIEGFIKLNFDIDQYDHEGRTPLHYAVKFQNLMAICALLDLGADFNIIDIDGETPYSLACKLKEEETCPKRNTKYPRIFEIFAKHMYKLKLVDLEISEINEKIINPCYRLYSKSKFDAFGSIVTCNIVDELQVAKNKVGACKQSMREFLKDPYAFYKEMDQEDRESFDEWFKTGDKRLAIYYPKWVGILRMQYRKVRAKTLLTPNENPSLFSSLYSYLPWA